MPNTWIDSQRLHPWVRRLWRVLVLAVALATLAPTVSRLHMAQAGVDGWVEVCSSTGMRWVSADGPDDPDSGPLTLDACDLCALACERFAALAPSPMGVHHLLITEHWSSVLALAPGALHTPTAQARAPPVCI